jgi:hypothetical protein
VFRRKGELCVLFQYFPFLYDIMGFMSRYYYLAILLRLFGIPNFKTFKLFDFQ